MNFRLPFLSVGITRTHSAKRRLVFVKLLMVSFLIGCVAVIAGAAVKRGWSLPFENRNARVAPIQRQRQQEVELITVRRFGFEPASISRSAGGFVLNFENHSNQPELVLTLNQLQENKSATKLSEVNLRNGQMNWLTYLDLQPGEYELTEAGHPAWKCRLTLKAQ